MPNEIVTFEMEKEIKQVIKGYIQRILKICKTYEGSTGDEKIDCPKCGGLRSIVWEGYWACHWSSCGFQFPENLTPPSPEELSEIFRARLREKKVTEFMREIGIDIDSEI